MASTELPSPLILRPYEGATFDCQVDISMDRSIIATISTTGSNRLIQLWEVSSGQTMREFEAQMDGRLIDGLRMSPDGTKIVVGDGTGSLKLWDIATGQEIRTLKGHETSITGLVFYPSGHRLVSVDFDCNLKIWDVASGEELWNYRLEAKTSSVLFNPAGTRVVSLSYQRTSAVYDVVGDRFQLRNHLPGGYYRMCWDSTGDRLFGSGGGVGDDGCLTMFEVDGGRVLWRQEGAHKDYITSVQFCCHDNRIISINTGDDERLKMWDAHSGILLYTLQCPLWVLAVGQVYSTTSGDYLVCMTRDNQLHLWTLGIGMMVSNCYSNIANATCMEFSADGSRMVVGTVYNIIHICSMPTRLEYSTAITYWESDYGRTKIVAVCISADGSHVAASTDDGRMAAWDVSGYCIPRLLHTFDGQSYDTAVLSMCISPAKDNLISMSRDKVVKVWSMETGQVLLALEGHERYHEPAKRMIVATSKDGKLIASGSDDSVDSVKIWDAHTGACLHTWDYKSNAGSMDGATVLLFNSRGDRLYIGQGNGYVTKWDLNTDQRCRFKETDSTSKRVVSLSLPADGHYLLSYHHVDEGGIQPAIHVWDEETGCFIKTLACGSLICAAYVNTSGDQITYGMSNGGTKLLSFPEGIVTAGDLLYLCSECLSPAQIPERLKDPAWAFKNDSKGDNILHSLFSWKPELLHDPWLLEALELNPAVRKSKQHL